MKMHIQAKLLSISVAVFGMASLSTIATLAALQPNPAQADDLDEQISDAIRSACHGYVVDMIPDFFEPAREWLYENSPVCREIVESEDTDVSEILSENDISMPAQDYDAFPTTLTNVEPDIGIYNECQDAEDTALCAHIRHRADDARVPLPQSDYDSVARYCDDPAEISYSGCVEHWLEAQWLAGDKSLPKRANTGLSLDSLMSDADADPISTTSSSNSFSMDSLMGGANSNTTNTNNQPSQRAASSNPSVATSINNPVAATDNESKSVAGGSLNFDNILGARNQIKTDSATQELFNKGGQIASQCQCVFNGNQCYKSLAYGYEALNTAVTNAQSNLEPQRTTLCNGWLTHLRGKTSNDLAVVNGYLDNTNKVLSNLETLDSSYYGLQAELDQKEVEIDKQIAYQQEQQRLAYEQQNSGPSGFQVLATVVGGAGILTSGIPADQAASLAQSFASDMLSDGSGSSMANTMQDYGYGSLEEVDYDQMAIDTREARETIGEINTSDNTNVQVQNSEAVNTFDHSASSMQGQIDNQTGNYGAVLYSWEPSDFSVGIATSKVSQDTALLAASKQCGSDCSAHEWIEPGQCGALVFGKQSAAAGKYVWWNASSNLSEAENAGLAECDFRARGFSDNNHLSCYVAVSGCN